MDNSDKKKKSFQFFKTKTTSKSENGINNENISYRYFETKKTPKSETGISDRSELFEFFLTHPKQQKVKTSPINLEEILHTNEKVLVSKIEDLISKKSKLNQKEKQISMTQGPTFFNQEEIYSKRFSTLIKKLYTDNRFIINEINKAFDVDILLPSDDDNYLTEEFLGKVDKLTTDILKYIYNKFKSYERAVNYIISLITSRYGFDYTLDHSSYISCSIIFYLFRINYIMKKNRTTSTYFSILNFKKLFSDLNRDRLHKIFRVLYEYILNNNYPSIFFSDNFDIITLKTVILRYLKTYSKILAPHFKIDTEDLYQESIDLFNKTLDNNSLETIFYNLDVKEPRYISGAILSCLIDTYDSGSLNNKELISLLHLAEKPFNLFKKYIFDLLEPFLEFSSNDIHVKRSEITYEKYKRNMELYMNKYKDIRYIKGLSPLVIFDDLLESINPNEFDSALQHIYNKLESEFLERSSFDFYIVLSFFAYNYYCIINNLSLISKKDFYERFFNRKYYTSLKLNIFFIELLTENINSIQKYSFLLSLLASKLMDSARYRYAFIYFCDIFLHQNCFLEIFDVKDKNLGFIKSDILKIYDEMISRKSFDNFYQILPLGVKSPKYVAVLLIFFYFSYIRGYFVNSAFFFNLFDNSNVCNTFPFILSRFYKIKKSIINTFFQQFSKQLFSNTISKIDFKHQGLTYTFHPVISRLKSINPELSKGLYLLFMKIASDSFPNNYFNNPTYRPSDFSLKGNHSERIYLADISQYFDRFIVKHRDFHGLCSEISQFISVFRNKYHKNPDHPPILNLIMEKYTKHAISTETPVWKAIDEIEHICGHIDLIFVVGNTLYICDYKPTLTEIYKKIPQLALYGNIIKSMLSVFCDISQFSVKCLGLCPNNALEFSPNIRDKVIDFIFYQNSIRAKNNRLLTIDGQDLEESFKKQSFF